MKIKRNDTVVVITGKSKGHVGKVLRVSGSGVLVEGANLVKKHVRPNPRLEIEGGIVTKELPLHVSNVALYNPATKLPGKVGYREIEKDGKIHKVRYFKSNNELVDLV